MIRKLNVKRNLEGKINDNKNNVLSLFNGMGCVWMALEECGIKVDKRYSSEIEKYPNHANDSLYSDTIQIGDVRNVDVSDLEYIHFLAGGSPCQSFSFAGKRNGMSTKCEIEILSLKHYLELKEQNFEFEGQSYLFWEYIRILTDIRKYNPDVKFLLENVVMGAKWQKVITQAIGINPVRINAALVSAQNRDRLFWTNINTEQDGFFGDLKCMIPQPKDKGILLKDILEPEVDKKYFLSQKALDYINRDKRNLGFQMDEEDEKSSCITAVFHKQIPYNQIKVYNTNAIEVNIVAMRGRNPDNPKSRAAGLPTEQQLESRTDGKTNCLTSVQKDNLVVYGCDYRTDDGLRVRENGKAGTLTARARNDESCGQLAVVNKIIRRLTPRECGRLQSVPEEKINILLNSGISDTQLYKMFGNGWNIKVISHILSFLNKKSP
jgi:DNA-cytosine methyltransferase